MSVYALIPVIGSGQRPAGEPAARHTVADSTMLEHRIARLLAAGVDHLVVTAPADQVDALRTLLGPVPTVVDGGMDRAEAITVALAEVDENADVVLVHHGEHAVAPDSLIAAVIGAVRAGHPAVVPVLAVVDTIRTVASDGSLTGLLDRATLRVVQTPHGFRPEVLRRAYPAVATDGWTPAGDAERVEQLGIPITVVAGDRPSIVTGPPDRPERITDP